MPSLHAADRGASEDMRMRRTSSQIMRDQASGGGDEEKYQALGDGDDKNKPCCGGRLSILSCIALIVTSIGLLLLILYLASPAMAKGLTNGAVVSFNSLQLSNIDMGANSADMSAEAVFTNTHGTSAKIHKTDVDLNHGGKKLATVHMPEFDFNGNSDNMIQLDQTLKVNANNFNDFVGQIFSEETVQVRFNSRFPMTIGALHTPFGVKGDIPAMLTGYNNFQDQNGGQTTVDIEATNEGTFLVITTQVNSDSEVELLGLNDAQFDIGFNGGDLASAETVGGFSIMRGPNTIILRGPINAPPTNAPGTMAPAAEEEAAVEEAAEEAAAEEAAEEAAAEEAAEEAAEGLEEEVAVDSVGKKILLQMSDDVSPADQFFSAIFAGNPLTLDASGSLVAGADSPINIQFTNTPAFEGPLIRSLGFATIFEQNPDVLSAFRNEQPTQIPVVISFFNPFNETVTITNVNFDFVIGELNAGNAFLGIQRLMNNPLTNDPNPNVDVQGTLPFGSVNFAGSFRLKPSSSLNGEAVLMTMLTTAGDDLLGAQDGDVIAQRLMEAGRNGKAVGMSVTGDFQFNIGDVSGNPIVESTMVAFGCDLDEDEMSMGRANMDEKGQIELACDQVLDDNEDLICPPDTPPVMCNIPQEEISDEFFTDRLNGQCREQRKACDINGGCNHVIDASHCILPDDVLAGPDDCWRRSGFIVPTSIVEGITTDYETWLNVTCCIQLACA